MKKEKNIEDLLAKETNENLSGLPVFVKLADPMPVLVDGTNRVLKLGKSNRHQTDFLDLYPQNKPISKILSPKFFI